MVSRAFLIALPLVLVAVYLGLNLVVRWIYPRQLFPYRGSSYVDSPDLRKTTAPDGNRIVLAYGPVDGDDAPLVLYFHGNGEDIGMNEERFAWFNSLGYGVLAPDYPGYGLSTGTPSGPSVRACAEAALAYARDELGYPADRIVLWGRSLGGGPALHLAGRAGFRAVVLESAFRSVFRLGVPFPLLLPEPFPNEKRIAAVAEPVFLFHGARDRVVPVSHARALARAAGDNASLTVFPDGTHNDLRFVGQAAMESLLADLRK